MDEANVEDVDDLASWNQLLSFIVTGLSNSYKDDHRLQKNIEHIESNIENIRQLIGKDCGVQLVEILINYSSSNRCAKQGFILLSLAVCSLSKIAHDVNTKSIIREAIIKICRIPTHLFMLLDFMYCMIDSVDSLAILKTLGLYHDFPKEKYINLRKKRGSSKKAKTKKAHVGEETGAAHDSSFPSKDSKSLDATDESNQDENSMKDHEENESCTRGNSDEQKLAGKRKSKKGRIKSHASIEKSLTPSQFISKYRLLLTAWYADKEKTPISLLYLLTKYQGRYKWNHKLIFRCAHVKIDDTDRDEQFQKNIAITYCLHGYDRAAAMFGQLQKGEYNRDIVNQRESRIRAFIDGLNGVKQVPNVLTKENSDRIIATIKHSERKQDVPLGGPLDYAIPGRLTVCKRAEAKSRTRLHIAMEHLPSVFMNSKEVWQALILDLPMTTFISNITRMDNLGLFDDDYEHGNENVDILAERIGCSEYIERAMIHPFKILTTLWMYMNEETKSHLTDTNKEQCSKICNILSEAFFNSFKIDKKDDAMIKPNLIIYIDNNKEMNEKEFLGFRCDISPTMGAVAMAMKIQRIEPNTTIFVGDCDFKTIEKNSLVDTMIAAAELTNNTNLSVPNNYEVNNLIDAFIIFTSNVSGDEPYSSFKQYKKSNVASKSKLIICAMGACSSMVDNSDDDDIKIIFGGDSCFLNEIYEFL